VRQLLIWVKGLLLRRFGRVVGAAIGVAFTTAFIGALGVFLSVSNAQMTQRAIHDVPVDWQVQLAPGADVSAVTAKVQETVKPEVLERVMYAEVDGFSAQTGGTVQTTGAGKVLGVSPGYFTEFPAELRRLVGATEGVLIAQQTSANLHVSVGDTVSILRVALPPAEVKVDGVIDLPNADSLFQAVGIPAGAAPQAPPDNVLILPDSMWDTLFKPQQEVRPDSVRTQLHLRLGQALPSSPGAAYKEVTAQANGLEARIAGDGIVGNNLASRLLSVNEDALYARVLFLFLGLPGVILVISLTLAVAASGGERRASDQALLRTRGATVGQILRLEAVEAVITGLGGVVLGLALTYASSGLLGITAREMRGRAAVGWLIFAACIGFALAMGAVLIPAWSRARNLTVATARGLIRPAGNPLWKVLWLDLIILAIGAVEYWRTASAGYQVVLAPEGVAASSVNYEAFIAPVCLWVGGIMLSFRLLHYALRHGRRLLAGILRPLAHSLSGLVAAALTRQFRLLTHGAALVALAISFSVSTAIFDTTFNAQSRVDAALTNGADVTVTGPTASPPSAKIAELKALPGVTGAQPMQHRFAYVGNDLQDLYGIDPGYIGDATSISNAYFGNHDARATLAELAATSDGVLVSEETVQDFQLKPGDQLNLRLQFASDRQYHVVPFHFIGVVREFPTAPTDSFLVANASYVAQQTGSDAAETVLLRVQGDPAAVAERAKGVVGDIPGAKVTDLGTVQRAISSSLTAVDLQGLTRLELVFAMLMVAAATGLVLGLGLAERRRMFAILTALGAKSAQLGAFLWGEALLILLVGLLLGGALGVAVAQVLVKMLTGIFDPPPERLAAPALYLVLLGLAAVVSTIIAVLCARAYSRHQVLESLRGL
jgi:putative ABC transport system permease protein